MSGAVNQVHQFGTIANIGTAQVAIYAQVNTGTVIAGQTLWADGQVTPAQLGTLAANVIGLGSIAPQALVANTGTVTGPPSGLVISNDLTITQGATPTLEIGATIARTANVLPAAAVTPDLVIASGTLGAATTLARTAQSLQLTNTGTNVQGVSSQVLFSSGLQANVGYAAPVSWVGGTNYNSSNPTSAGITGVQQFTGTVAATTQAYGGSPFNSLLIEDTVQSYLAGGTCGFEVSHNVGGWPAAGARGAFQCTIGVTTTMNGAGAAFTGSISGSTLTVSALAQAVFVGTLETSGVLVVSSINSGTVEVGTFLSATGLPGPTAGNNQQPVMITAPVSGASGGVGSYVVNQQPTAQVVGTFTAAGYLGVGAVVQQSLTANLQGSVNTGGTLTVTQMYGGTIVAGGYLSGGSGLPTACVVQSQLSGTTGGVGTYLVSPAPSAAVVSANLLEYPVIPGTQVVGALTGTGGVGTYRLSQGQTVASRSMTFALAAGEYSSSGTYCQLNGNDNGCYGNPQTSLFGANPNVSCGPFATFLSEVKGGEVDVTTPVFFQPAGSPNPAPQTVVGWHIGEAKYSNGQQEDACFMMTGQGDLGGVFTNVGILFNSPIRSRALGPTSTLMQACSGPFVSTSTFAVGVDFLNSGKVAFTGNAWQSPGAAIGPTGGGTLASIYVPGRTATIAAQTTITVADAGSDVFINAGTTAMVAYIQPGMLPGFAVHVWDDTGAASPTNPLNITTNTGTICQIESPYGHARVATPNGTVWRYSA